MTDHINSSDPHPAYALDTETSTHAALVATEIQLGHVQLATAAETVAGVNGTKATHPAGVKAAIDAFHTWLVGVAPSTLDQISEIAIALGNDPNFTTTIMTALALKAPLNSAALTGTPTAPTAVPGTSTTQIATTAFVTTIASKGRFYFYAQL